ncbi:MAG TPA: hypothetical protein PKN33_07970 [Phycisphaerae bacterium]|nr:hypothetical protein [Phycisphaerae bacterium]
MDHHVPCRKTRSFSIGKWLPVRIAWWLLSATFVIMTMASTALADPTLIDFEDITAPATITTQYNAKGVIFGGHFLRTDATAHSGTQALQSVNPSDFEFDPGPLTMTFTSPQTLVRLFAGVPVTPVNGTMFAYDVNDMIVAQDGPKVVAGATFDTAFEVTVATPTIMKVELLFEGTNFEEIDDLEFEGEPPAPPPLLAPVIVITTPEDGVDLDVDTLEIAGTVSGEGLLSPVRMTLDYRLPPESSAPPFTSALSLTGTGTERQFSLPGGFGGLPMGPITLTVEAENTGGLKGTATATFNNLPTAIRDRIVQENLNGAPQLGEFSFGIVAGGCKIAVYDNGAVSVDDADNTFVFRGDIFTKWLSLRGLFNNDGFGCPLSEERVGPGDTTVQDFDGGRIYADLSTGTAYVPTVFVDVLDTRELEFLGPPTSVPLADPVSPVEPVQTSTRTWLYQQFVRPTRPDLVPATLEIRGTPPRLWVERQSPTVSAKTGALWDNYACTGNLGPCTVDPPQTEFPLIENAGDQFCGGEALEDQKLDILVECVATDLKQCGKGEWEPIKGDQYLGTPVYGVVVESALAGEDFPFSHTWTYDSPPFCSSVFGCPSDWTLQVSPLGPHRDIGDLPSLFAAGNKVSGIGPGDGRLIEFEYERFYGEFVGWMGFPEEGDLIYAVGRWIIDCGHNTFRSELHPIYMYAKMKTVTTITDPFTGLVNTNPFGGQPATRADIWVNGWYPGGDGPERAIEFDIYPPPRPSPTATLVVNKPDDNDAVHEITIEYSIQPETAANHVHIKFTAPYRENFVNIWGQVFWEVNRGYEGQWFVYWAE